MSSTVTFRGRSSRSGPLTWGQRWSWDIVRELVPNEHRLNLWTWVRIADGATVESLIAAVTDMVATHEILRTTYRTGSDGEPEQVVLADGRIPVEIRAAEPDTARQVVEELRVDLVAGRFDLSCDLPVRLGIVTCGGAPVVLEVAMSFMATDDWGMNLFAREALARLAGTFDDGPALAAPQPLDQAAFERSAAAHAMDRAAYRHWEEQLAAIRAIPGPVLRPAGESPRYWNGAFSSIALSRAADILADRLRVPPSAVLLAGLCALLGLRKGQPAFGLFLAANNRYRQETRNAHGIFRENVPMYLDLDEGTFADLVRTAALRMFRATRHGQADPVRVARLVHGCAAHRVSEYHGAVRRGAERQATAHRVSDHRGAHLALPVVFDYHHQDRAPVEPGQCDIRELRYAARDSTFGWLDTAEEENLHLYVKVPRTDARDQIWFWTDTTYLSRADLVAVAFGLERLVIEAVAGEVKLVRLEAVTGVTPPPSPR